ncbi:MAG: type II secretion system F family protein [Desulfovibrionaceae bacterium]|nr:type II secretion system F family protein [Desulfovibrionaceae bacterium]MBF0512887.1 type II secretion system F family protein [Desulfovibrionaceae bacterium]
MDYAIAAFVVAALGYLVYAVTQAVSASRDAGRESVRRRLTQMDAPAEEAETQAVDIVKNRQLSSLPAFDLILSRLHWTEAISRVVAQADITVPLGVIVLAALVMGAFGYLAAYALSHHFLVALGAGAAAALGPALWVRSRKKQRMARFEEQLPEALGLVARALKAGHTFSSGMGLVAAEFEEPIRGEFGKTLEEINFGMNVQEALDNLSVRVDCGDLRFFVISVKIQSETGGNLAEIVENIAALIRERFKLKGRVRVLSAEGRFAAWILCSMPPGIALVINFLNPDYLSVLFTEELGKMMLYTAGAMMLVGVLVTKRMINIKV